MTKSARKMSRRQILQGIAGLLASFGLTACEIVAYTPTPAVPTPAEVETVVPTPTRRPWVESVYVELMIGSVAGWEIEDFRELLRRFHSYYPGIRIDLDLSGQGESQRYRVALRVASGTGFDVAHVVGSHLTYIDAGLFTDLRTFDKADKSFEIGAYYSSTVDHYSVPGDGVYCLPWTFATESLYYNKGHFADASLSTPNVAWTWDDLRHAARLLTKHADSDEAQQSWGVEFLLNNLDYVLRSFGGGFPIGRAENAEAIHRSNLAALQFVADLVLSERVHPYPRLGLTDGFARGKVSMAFLPEWAATRLNAVEELDYDVAPIPQGPVGSVAPFKADGVGMSWECHYPDHSWEVMKWFAHADFGEWSIAHALLFPEGISTSLRVANEYCWTTYHEIPENRRVFLQVLETAMVPFSNSLWWPHLSQNTAYSKWSGWQPFKRVLEGGATLEQAVSELEDNWLSVGLVEIEKHLNDVSWFSC